MNTAVSEEDEPISLGIVQFIRKNMPHKRAFHARQVYDAFVTIHGNLPNFNAVMRALEVSCDRLGGGYFRQ